VLAVRSPVAVNVAMEVLGSVSFREALEGTRCTDWCRRVGTRVVEVGCWAPACQSVVAGGVETCKDLFDCLVLSFGWLCRVL
jgi:hypothetical protein